MCVECVGEWSTCEAMQSRRTWKLLRTANAYCVNKAPERDRMPKAQVMPMMAKKLPEIFALNQKTTMQVVWDKSAPSSNNHKRESGERRGSMFRQTWRPICCVFLIDGRNSNLPSHEFGAGLVVRILQANSQHGFEDENEDGDVHEHHDTQGCNKSPDGPVVPLEPACVIKVISAWRANAHNTK